MDAKYRAAAWNNKDGKFNCHGLYTSADTYGHALHKLYIFFQKYYPDQTKLINEAMDDLDKKCNVIRGLNERQRQVPSGSIRLRRKDKYLEGETIEEKDLLSSESHKDIPVYETDTETVGTA